MSDSNSSNLILSRLQFLQEKKDNTKYWNISWLQGVFLSDFIQLSSPKNILEIGTSNGFSTLWLAKGANLQTQIYTIEVNEDRFNEAKKNFDFCNLENIHQLKGEIFDILGNYNFECKFDLIFIDAAHKFYKELVLRIEKLDLLTENAIIIADNVLSHSYMSEFIKFMNKKYDCNLIEFDSGFLVAHSKLK